MVNNYSEIKKRLNKLVENRNYYFKDTLIEDAERYLDKRRKFIGMEEEEILEIEKELNYKFPHDFRLYLEEFGTNCGELFCLGQNLNPKELTEYQNWGKELLEENEIINFINKDTIFFEFHQGYAFSCFHQDQKNETKIFQYVEGDEKPVKRFENFRSMLESETTKLEKVHKELRKSDGHFVIIKNGYVRQEYPARNSGQNPKKIGDRFIDVKSINPITKMLKKIFKK